jgi:hypothetical protein
MDSNVACVSEFVGLMKLRIEAGIVTDAVNMSAVFYGILIRSGTSPHNIVLDGKQHCELSVTTDSGVPWLAQFHYDVLEPATLSERSRSTELFANVWRLAFPAEGVRGGFIVCVTNCRETVFTAKTYETVPMVLKALGQQAVVKTIWNLKLANGCRFLVLRVAPLDMLKRK